MPHDIKTWDNISLRCDFLNTIQTKEQNDIKLTEEEIRKVSTFAFQFGEAGKKRLKLIAIKSDFELDYVDNLWSENEHQLNDETTICNKMCSEIHRCQIMKIINGYSPFQIPTESRKKYTESEAVNIIEKYFGDDIIYQLSTQRFYEYFGGVWKVLDEEKLNMRIEALLLLIYPENEITNFRLDSVCKRLKKRSRLFFDDHFNNEKFILNFKNGLYNLQTGKLSPHERSYKTNVQFPVEYVPNAECKLFIKTLDEIFESRQDVVDYFLKWMLYTLMPTYEVQKALFMYGKGRNGKSLLMDIWSALIGQDNVSNQEFNKLAEDKDHSVFQLIDKYANFSREISTLEKDSHLFKTLTGKDVISARQIYGKPVDFKNKARLIISTNQLPKFKLIDQAVLRRIDIINFGKQFDLKDDKILDKKLINELPGILNLVLSKAHEIIGDDGAINFTPPQSVSENLKLFSSQSSTVSEYINECCTLSVDEHTEYATTLKNLYDYYCRWCRSDLCSDPKSNKIFKEEIAQLFNCNTYTVNSVQSISGKVYKKINWVLGISTNDPEKDYTAHGGKIRELLGLPDFIPAEPENENIQSSKLTGTYN
ncbi:MAG: hypothetical protein KJ571_07105 [Bacteroidetes bacterium]|nr:hypothetical protein [Bacteroidota bacterium]